tara:strand:- start:255 stop:443 length:189 start_codon:yes stop_codon:yes gene_type:complete
MGNRRSSLQLNEERVMDKAIGTVMAGAGVTLLVLGASIDSIEMWEIVGCSLTTALGAVMCIK